METKMNVTLIRQEDGLWSLRVLIIAVSAPAGVTTTFESKYNLFKSKLAAFEYLRELVDNATTEEKENDNGN